MAVWLPSLVREPRFLIYSITKTFTAVLILRLGEQGRLQLTDFVDRWFPDLAQVAGITVKQLLNHTAGIPDYGGLAAYHADLRSAPAHPWSFDRFVSETIGRGLLFEPGTSWSYSNPGYMLLRRIAERVSGKSYSSLIAEQIAAPLALRETTVAESLDDMSALAAGISCELAADGESRDVRAFYHPGWVSHGVIASTCSDIARFFDALFGGRLLSPGSVHEMLDLIPVGNASSAEGDSSPLRPASPGYGLGLMGDRDSPWGFLVGHNGGGPCYRASAFHLIGSEITVCAMTAIEQGFDTESIVAQVLDGSTQL
jgi:D-alanyl-D-alanine carboxypeptidase